MKYLKSSVLSFIFVLTAVFAVACGDNEKASTPESTAIAFVENSANGDADGMLELIDLSNLDEASNEMVKGKIKAVAVSSKEKTASKGGVEKIEVTKTDLNKDGNQARVRVQITYKDKTVTNDSVNIIKTNNEWRVKI